MNRQFPRLEVDASRIRSNAQQIAARCRARGIAVCGVIKGVNGLPEIVRTYKEAGIAELGTSRIEQIVRCREAGIEGPYLLIRIPGLSELPDVVRRCDCSLQSERAVLDALARECARQEKTHSVIVMADLGDLREGFWDREEMVETCVHVERELPHVHLRGVGVNLSCYGSIRPTPEKMNELIDIAREVERRIGRPLETVSGGATSSYTLVHSGAMPEGINHLRIGDREVHFEFGRSIVAECGELITTVLFNKTTATGRKLVIVDASMTELVRPAMYGSYHNIENITAKDDEVREKYTVVGTACESTDVFDENVTLRRTHRGDLLTIKSAGAYGMSMASRYNLHDLPGAVYSDEIK